MRSPLKLQTANLKLQLRQGKAEAEALFLSIGEGAIVTDSNGHISRVNQPAIDILGFSKKEMIGKWYPEALIAEDAHGQVIKNINRPITKVFLTGQAVTARLYYRRK